MYPEGRKEFANEFFMSDMKRHIEGTSELKIHITKLRGRCGVKSQNPDTTQPQENVGKDQVKMKRCRIRPSVSDGKSAVGVSPKCVHWEKTPKQYKWMLLLMSLEGLSSPKSLYLWQFTFHFYYISIELQSTHTHTHTRSKSLCKGYHQHSFLPPCMINYMLTVLS